MKNFIKILILIFCFIFTLSAHALNVNGIAFSQYDYNLSKLEKTFSNNNFVTSQNKINEKYIVSSNISTPIIMASLDKKSQFGANSFDKNITELNNFKQNFLNTYTQLQIISFKLSISHLKNEICTRAP